MDNEYDYITKYQNLGESTDNELVLRRGKVYDICGPGDDRLQVQILPDFQDIPDNELSNLPKYWPFIKNTYSPFKTIKNSGDKAEWVWCICSKDLQLGYVVGQLGQIATDKEEVEKNSYNYKSIEKYLSNRQVRPKDFEYRDYVVVYSNMSDKGGSIQMYSRKTGDWILMNSTGGILTLQQDKFYARIGTPNPGGDASAFSSIKMTVDSIEFNTTNFSVNAPNVKLGNHGLTLAGLLAGPSVGMNQIPVIPCNGITC